MNYTVVSLKTLDDQKKFVDYIYKKTGCYYRMNPIKDGGQVILFMNQDLTNIHPSNVTCAACAVSNKENLIFYNADDLINWYESRNRRTSAGCSANVFKSSWRHCCLRLIEKDSRFILVNIEGLDINNVWKTMKSYRYQCVGPSNPIPNKYICVNHHLRLFFSGYIVDESFNINEYQAYQELLEYLRRHFN